MGGGNTTNYGIFKAAGLSNRNKEKEKLEKEKRYHKEIFLHETDEHVTKKGV